jgi:hypothetical protein
MKQCRVGGCGRAAEGFGRLCNTHKTRERRHGHAEQSPVSAAELRPYAKHIKQWIAKRRNSDAIWTNLRTAYGALVKDAEGELRAADERHVRVRPRYLAWRDIINVAGTADEDTAILTLIGFGYLTFDKPKRFRSDKAAFVQCARRFRALSDVHVAEFYSEKDRRSHRVYRDPSPAQALFLGQLLMSKMGVVGGAIHSKMIAAEAASKVALSTTLEAIAQSTREEQP